MEIDRFYNELVTLLANYRQAVVDKEFILKATPIEEVPINIAKGKVLAVKELEQHIAKLYNKFKPHSEIE